MNKTVLGWAFVSMAVVSLEAGSARADSMADWLRLRTRELNAASVALFDQDGKFDSCPDGGAPGTKNTACVQKLLDGIIANVTQATWNDPAVPKTAIAEAKAKLEALKNQVCGNQYGKDLQCVFREKSEIKDIVDDTIKTFADAKKKMRREDDSELAMQDKDAEIKKLKSERDAARRKAKDLQAKLDEAQKKSNTNCALAAQNSSTSVSGTAPSLSGQVDAITKFGNAGGALGRRGHTDEIDP